MVRNLLFIFLLFIGLSVTAQFSHNPTSMAINTPISDEEIVYEVFFTNESDSTYTIFWKLEKEASFEAGWELSVCDLNLCYQPSVNQCPPSKPNVFPKNSLPFQFHFKNNNIAGYSVVGVKFYADKNFTQEVMSTTLTLNVGTSSTKNQSLSSTKIFPNPAISSFQLTNANNVKKVIVYNMFGKEVKTFFHYNNAQHEISDLKTGMYVVKLIDEKNKVIKTLKLNKAYEGV